jgi:hypothetical protein
VNLGNFDRQAREESRRVVHEAEETIRSFATQAYSDLQAPALENGGAFGSPVASGRFAASMRLEINQIDHTTEPADPEYRYGKPPPARTLRNRPISQIVAKLRRFRIGDTIYISNSVPYVRKIEIGRHSWQTPEGVFEPTFRRLIARFKHTVAGLRVSRRA